MQITKKRRVNLKWTWGAWLRQGEELRQEKKGNLPDEMGDNLIILFKSVCRHYPAWRFSGEPRWFSDEGYPLDAAQDIIYETIRAVRSNCDPETRHDREIHRYARSTMKNEIERYPRRPDQEEKKKVISYVEAFGFPNEEEDEESPEESIMDAEAHAFASQVEKQKSIRSAMADLNSQEILAIYWHFCKGLGLVETALQISNDLSLKKFKKATAENRYKAALEKLRDRLSRSEKEGFRENLCAVVAESVKSMPEMRTEVAISLLGGETRRVQTIKGNRLLHALRENGVNIGNYGVFFGDRRLKKKDGRVIENPILTRDAEVVILPEHVKGGREEFFAKERLPRRVKMPPGFMEKLNKIFMEEE